MIENLRRALRERGYVDGQNKISIDFIRSEGCLKLEAARSRAARQGRGRQKIFGGRLAVALTFGIQVTAAGGAVEGLRPPERDAFDALVLDVMLPDGDGLKTQRAQKDAEPTPRGCD